MIKKGTVMECYARRKQVRVIALRITRSGDLLAFDALRSCYLRRLFLTEHLCNTWRVIILLYLVLMNPPAEILSGLW